MLDNILLVIGAYLFGSLPVLYWIGRWRGVDLRKEYDMHLSLWRKVGYREGLTGILLDIFRGPIFPLIAWGLDMSKLTIGLAGLAVVAGQMWPLFHGFRHGGKGNTVGVGASFAMAPLAMGWATISIATGALLRALPKLRRSAKKEADRFKFSGVSNSMPLGMFGGFGSLPLIAWLLDEDMAMVWCLVGLFGMLMFRRLTADLGKDMKAGLKTRLTLVLVNRFFLDRNYYRE